MARAPREPKSLLRRTLNALAVALAWLMPWRWPGLIKDRRTTANTAPSPPEPEQTRQEAPAAAVKDNRLWPDGRLALAERLWGEGQTLPGARNFVSTYLPLMALNEKKSIAILGTNLGGLNERLVNDTKVWITGYENDPELAELGAQRMVRAGLTRKAPITFDDMEALELKPKSLDAVISLESLYPVKNKDRLFRAIADGLRLDGELFYTDYVLPGASPPTPAVIDWFKSEPRQPHLWTADNTQAFLVSLGLDVRPFQDITADHRRQVLQGWMRFLGSVSKAELLDMAEDVFAECAFWAKRMAALDSGGLRVYKFNAFKAPGH